MLGKTDSIVVVPGRVRYNVAAPPGRCGDDKSALRNEGRPRCVDALGTHGRTNSVRNCMYAPYLVVY